MGFAVALRAVPGLRRRPHRRRRRAAPDDRAAVAARGAAGGRRRGLLLVAGRSADRGRPPWSGSAPRSSSPRPALLAALRRPVGGGAVAARGCRSGWASTTSPPPWCWSSSPCSPLVLLSAAAQQVRGPGPLPRADARLRRRGAAHRDRHHPRPAAGRLGGDGRDVLGADRAPLPRPARPRRPGSPPSSPPGRPTSGSTRGRGGRWPAGSAPRSTRLARLQGGWLHLATAGLAAAGAGQGRPAAVLLLALRGDARAQPGQRAAALRGDGGDGRLPAAARLPAARGQRLGRRRGGLGGGRQPRCCWGGRGRPDRPQAAARRLDRGPARVRGARRRGGRGRGRDATELVAHARSQGGAVPRRRGAAARARHEAAALARRRRPGCCPGSGRRRCSPRSRSPGSRRWRCGRRRRTCSRRCTPPRCRCTLAALRRPVLSAALRRADRRGAAPPGPARRRGLVRRQERRGSREVAGWTGSRWCCWPSGAAVARACWPCRCSASAAGVARLGRGGRAGLALGLARPLPARCPRPPGCSRDWLHLDRLDARPGRPTGDRPWPGPSPRSTTGCSSRPWPASPPVPGPPDAGSAGWTTGSSSRACGTSSAPPCWRAGPPVADRHVRTRPSAASPAAPARPAARPAAADRPAAHVLRPGRRRARRRRARPLDRKVAPCS